eukprot:g2521.t1
MYQPNEEERTGIVIDNGSDSVKAGFTGDAAPRSCFRTMVGRSKHAGIMVATGMKSAYVGNEAHEKRGTLDLSYPIQGGEVSNWKDAEKMWHYTFYEALKVPPEEHPVLMTDAPLNSMNKREKMVELLFETFNVPAMYVGMQAVLSLYAAGRTTGCVLDYGHGASHTVPVYEGYALPHSIRKETVVGEDITQYLKELLHEKGYHFSTLAELEVIRELKDRMTYVALDYEKEMVRTKEDLRLIEKRYELPDGSVLHLGEERFKCAETFFKPSLLGKTEALSIHESVVKCIENCEFSIRKTLYDNITICGGSTLFPNFDLRLQSELASSAPPSTVLSVVAAPERKYSAWIGGSILSSLETFGVMWVRKEEFEETGAVIVHRKCF